MASGGVEQLDRPPNREQPRVVRLDPSIEQGDDLSGRGRKDPGVAYQQLHIVVALTDAVAAAAAVIAASMTGGVSMTALGLVAFLIVGLPVWIAAFAVSGLYETHRLTFSEEVRRVFSAVTLGALLLTLGGAWFDMPLTRGWIATAWLVALSIAIAFRSIWFHHRRHRERDGSLTFRTLIVGTNDEAERVGHSLLASSTGFDPLGYLRTSSPIVSANGLAVLGSIHDLADVAARSSADCVLIASSAVTTDEAQLVSRAARRFGLELRMTCNLPPILDKRLRFQRLGGATAVSIATPRLTGLQSFLKRTFDIGVGSLALLLSLPLLAAIALLVRATSDGPAFFRQVRVTEGRRRFTMYKFRTMVPDPDRLIANRVVELTDPFFKLEDDPRLTRIGRQLRRFSLDELPQLWNVIRGDMSLVGPRPLPVEQVETHPELLGPRCEVKAGMTGWWQINGRSDLDPEEAIALDDFYIENWSLSLDLYVVLKTAIVLLTRKGAR